MITRNVTTKPDKDGKPVNTALTFDFTGCTPEILQAYTMQALTVRRQSHWRSKGQTIPAKETVIVKDHVPGMRAAPQSAEQMLANMSAEDRAALLKKYEAELKNQPGKK